MRQSELKHELRIKKSAWFIRFFVWLYEADKEDVNFCKLFWGYVFAIPIMILGAIVLPISKVLNATQPGRNARKTARRASRAAAKLPGSQRKPSLPMRFISFVGDVASRGIYLIGSGWDKLNQHRRVITSLVWATWILGALLGLAGVAFISVVFVDNFGVTRFILLGIITVVLFSVTFLVLDKIGAVGWATETVMIPTGRGIRRGTLGFFGTVRTGFHAVKTNTCPRINLVDDDE